jgi:hypothetical protein
MRHSFYYGEDFAPTTQHLVHFAQLADIAFSNPIPYRLFNGDASPPVTYPASTTYNIGFHPGDTATPALECAMWGFKGEEATFIFHRQLEPRHVVAPGARSPDDRPQGSLPLLVVFFVCVVDSLAEYGAIMVVNWDALQPVWSTDRRFAGITCSDAAFRLGCNWVVQRLEVMQEEDPDNPDDYPSVDELRKRIPSIKLMSLEEYREMIGPERAALETMMP